LEVEGRVILGVSLLRVRERRQGNRHANGVTSSCTHTHGIRVTEGTGEGVGIGVGDADCVAVRIAIRVGIRVAVRIAVSVARAVGRTI
jgi:hypothetical protein